ncbi:MerR family transcriptional regulator [Flavobacteriaceae bacterium]|nr:MerR family transcriptional regulator [Flavobacteriaceae bacterium]MDB4025298.1 MerR family transcriptional regulator [Flavobacteriaceae bacterium]MDC1343826.1 MerR family transcriptional regulator [Flavobacteriaceae bacterium]
MDTIKNNFSIKDLENITGVKAHTIRIWEKRYDLLSPERSETNIRYYSNKNLQKLLNIVLLNNNNYKISKISEMKDDEISFTARELVLDRAINEEAINSLKLAMFQFDKTLFNNIYSRLLLKKTFKEIFAEIFIPFLEHVGLLWQTETILPAHEHFVSNLISQKVQVNTEELKYTTIISDTTYVLFLPENEIHELGLLYLNYELVLRGYKTIYLGQSLPIDNLNYFFGIGKNVCFITSMTIKPYDDKITDYFNELDTILNNSNHSLIAIGKKAMEFLNHDFQSQISLYPTISELLKEI